MGKAVVLSTHRLDEAERVCDRFGLLHRGNLIYGTFAEDSQGYRTGTFDRDVLKHDVAGRMK